MARYGGPPIAHRGKKSIMCEPSENYINRAASRRSSSHAAVAALDDKHCLPERRVCEKPLAAVPPQAGKLRPPPQPSRVRRVWRTWVNFGFDPSAAQ